MTSLAGVASAGRSGEHTAAVMTIPPAVQPAPGDPHPPSSPPHTVALQVAGDSSNRSNGPEDSAVVLLRLQLLFHNWAQR